MLRWFWDFLLQVCKRFVESGFMADADLDSGCLLNKKIRNAQLSQYNFILGKKVSDQSKLYSNGFYCEMGLFCHGLIYV